ncbi:glycosyltransferase family 4 protein [Clostridium akagii]|uniref:glycosyltransferase family 4 protein n=1 Tax=Clostridium akagii TaxID=91623 RepID=UPI00047967F8|nr:glycosyltransferase family 1 protein [Clostridium akagii]
MRVALFTDTFLPQVNGVTNTLSKLIEYYKSKNIEYLVFAPDSYLELNKNYNVEKFVSIKFFLYPECRLSLPNIFRLRNSLLKFKPDIIHIMTELNMGIAGLTYGKKLGIPTISSYTTNFVQYLKYYNLDMFQNALWNYMRWFHNQNEITLCPSMETKKLLISHGINNTGIFSRGIDINNFNDKFRSIELRKQLGIHDKIVLLYVGRVAKEKDINILQEGYAKILNRYKDKVALIITGNGPELEVYKKSFPKGTIFTGYKIGSELAKIYASSDIFVFPSRTETFGNVVLEAMASGLTVIAANAGGVKDTVDNGINGMLFKPGDAEDLANLIIEIIEDKSLMNNIKHNATKTVLERSWDCIFQNLIKTYENIILSKKCKQSIIS